MSIFDDSSDRGRVLGGSRTPQALNGGTSSRPRHGLSGPPRGTVVADAGGGRKPRRPDAKPKADKPAPTKEISVVATFANPFKSPSEEIKAMKENRWEPSTDDFTAVAGQAVRANSYLQLLAVSLVDGNAETKAGSIGRINIFTHANSDLISLGGRISAGGMTTSVFLTESTGLSEDTLDNLNKSGVPFTVNSSNKKIAAKKFTLKDVRSRFAPGAVIVIYACHTGVDGAFLQRIADTFQVKVRGFDDVIGYFPAFDEGARPTINRRRVGIGHDSQVKVSDFHQLDSSSKVVEKVPRAAKDDDDE